MWGGLPTTLMVLLRWQKLLLNAGIMIRSPLFDYICSSPSIGKCWGIQIGVVAFPMEAHCVQTQPCLSTSSTSISSLFRCLPSEEVCFFSFGRRISGFLASPSGLGDNEFLRDECRIMYFLSPISIFLFRPDYSLFFSNTGQEGWFHTESPEL